MGYGSRNAWKWRIGRLWPQTIRMLGMDYVIAAVKALYEDRESIPNMRIIWGHNLPMRHFHAFLEPYPNEEK